MTIAGDIRAFIDRELEDPVPTSVDPLAEALVDSVVLEALIAHLEDSYEITFDDDDIVEENFASVEALAGVVDRKRGA